METIFTRLPWHTQIGAFVVLGAVIVGSFYHYYEKPARAAMSSRESQLALQRAEVPSALAAAKRLPELRARVDDFESRLANLGGLVPDKQDAGDVLRLLHAAASQSNLLITSFKPAASETKPLHAEWPISLELVGTYHNLVSFFGRVGRFTRIVNITGLDIHRNPSPKPGATISASCVVTVMLLDGSALKFDAAASTAWKPASLHDAEGEAPETDESAFPMRRDPFLGLLDDTPPDPPPAPLGRGKAGLTTAELSVRGVMKSRDSFVALVRGRDGATFLIREGDVIADGAVEAVDAEGLVVVRNVDDQKSLGTQREVRKKLQSLQHQATP
jgi:type IV pilus assembly protein PilO